MTRWLGKPEPVTAATTDRYESFQRRYYSDPVAFARECINWPAGSLLTGYQADIMAAVPVRRRVSAVGPHGLGKSAQSALLILWFALTRDGRDWKAITTASVWRQLEEYLWPEIHKWARALRWEKIGRQPFTDSELLILSLNLRTGSAFAIASDKASALEGAHADHLLYLFDESKAVPDSVFDAAEGAFSTTGEIFAVAVSTPGDVTGRFHAIHTDRERFSEWWVRQVTLQECVDAGRVSMDWANARRREWGETSSAYINRVEGRFAYVDQEGGLIPRSHIKLAQERWKQIKAEMDKGKRLPFIGYGVDVGGESESADATVIAPRYLQYFIDELIVIRGADAMQVAAQVHERLRMQRGRVVVDTIGEGAGVAARLRMLNDEVHSFKGSEGTDETDTTGEIGFANMRAYSYWRMKELLNPVNGYDIALPPDKELEDDLCAVTAHEMRRGVIIVDDKREIIKRLGRSPDRGDAVVMAMVETKPARRSSVKGPGRVLPVG